MPISRLASANSTPRSSLRAALISRRPFSQRPANYAASFVTLVTVLVLAITGCASSGVKSASCGVDARDSIFAAAGPVYRDCAVDTKAKLTNPEVHTDFQPPQRNGCYSTELEFVVGTDGRPELSTVRTVSANDQNFATAVLESLRQWHYTPALRGGIAVRQIVVEKRSAMTSVVRVPKGGTARPPDRAPNC
jgi:hypothetical protein